MKLIPSLLAADPLHLEQEISTVIDAGADLIHLDIMDNHYVPNLTFGSAVCRAIHQRFPSLPIDVHLMTSPVDSMILQFSEAHAKRISIHPEATLHLDRSLALIREHGCEAGLALNPATSEEWLTWCRHRLDFVLIMTVNPGFGGQDLIPSMVEKIKRTRKAYPELPISVDGGVTTHTIRELFKAGATEFIIGTGLFDTTNYKETLATCRNATK